MVKLFRCKLCGEPYIGETRPSRCPLCGAYEGFMIEAKDYKETFDVQLNEKDKSTVEKALEIEISNTIFYFCASERTDDIDGKQLFKALGRVEAEHASIWRKILKVSESEMPKTNKCFTGNKENLQESHEREAKAIEFYRQSSMQSSNIRVKQIFAALVQVETDHLKLSEERLK